MILPLLIIRFVDVEESIYKISVIKEMGIVLGSAVDRENISMGKLSV